MRLSDTSLAEHFLGFLRRAGCIVGTAEVSAHGHALELSVELPAAYDETQARMELALYVLAWEAVHPGSGAEVLG